MLSGDGLAVKQPLVAVKQPLGENRTDSIENAVANGTNDNDGISPSISSDISETPFPADGADGSDEADGSPSKKHPLINAMADFIDNAQNR